MTAVKNIDKPIGQIHFNLVKKRRCLMLLSFCMADAGRRPADTGSSFDIRSGLSKVRNVVALSTLRILNKRQA
jgi:hypothetical protein